MSKDTKLPAIVAGLLIAGALIYVVGAMIAGREENKAAEQRSLKAGERLGESIREGMRQEIEGKPSVAAIRPLPRSARVTGVSERTDGTGDVRDGDYRKSTRSWPGNDLVRVRLEADEHSLTAILTAMVDFPVSVSGDDTRGYWSLNAASPDGDQAISLRAKVWDTGWSTDSIRFDGGDEVHADTIRVDGKRLILTFSRASLPVWMSRPFKWWVGSEWKGTWRDRVPNDGGKFLGAPTIPFPGHSAR